MPERGFKPIKEDGRILDQIRQRGWALFVETPYSDPISIVREFYAATRETQNGISFVRGKQVHYTPQAISALYHLPTPSPTATLWVQAQLFEKDLDKLMEDMCKSRTSWKTKAGTTQKIHFPQTALNRYLCEHSSH